MTTVLNGPGPDGFATAASITSRLGLVMVIHSTAAAFIPSGGFALEMITCVSGIGGVTISADDNRGGKKANNVPIVSRARVVGGDTMARILPDAALGKNLFMPPVWR